MVFKLITEGLYFAWQSIVNNKLRTFLSLLGVSIGIMAIISVFTIVDSLENNVRDSVQSLGENVVYIQKWPWVFGGEYPWWKYYTRPDVSYKEFRFLSQKSTLSDAVAFVFGGSRNVKRGNNILEDVEVNAITYEYSQIISFDIEKGRYFTQAEMISAKNYVLIGHQISEALFGLENPIGKRIKIAGINTIIIGLIEKEGESITGNSQDERVLCSYQFGKRFLNQRTGDPVIVISTKSSVSNSQLKNEIRGLMRTIRRVRPLNDDNFALNETSVISESLNSLFSVINLSGWVIGGFSILVGGFGIANIMFVSVKERTRTIGIQKALGAQNYFILLQVLFESVFLCFLGGLLGLIIVWVLAIVSSFMIEFTLGLSIENIVLGLSVSIFIGVLSGLVPAISASRLDPVEAIRR